jgi:hypothetical protein
VVLADCLVREQNQKQCCETDSFCFHLVLGDPGLVSRIIRRILITTNRGWAAIVARRWIGQT